MSQDALTAAERTWIEAALRLVPRNPRLARSRLGAKLARTPRHRRAFRARLERALGHSLRATGEYESAVAAYQRARRAFAAQRDPLEGAITALGLIDACMYLGRRVEALRVARAARRVFARRGDRLRLGKLETNVANLFHRADALDEALKHYRLARRHLRHHGTKSDLARVDYNRANVLASLGRTEEARASFAQARQAFVAAGETVLAAQVGYGDACLDLVRGDYASAMARLESVRLRLARLGARPLLALADLDLAECLLALRLYPEALAVARSAARWFAAKRVPLQLASAEYLVGSALLQLDRTVPGLAALDRAAAGFRRQRHDSGWASVELARAAAALRGGRPLAAWRHAERAERIFRRRRLRLRGFLAGIAGATALYASRKPARAASRARALLRRFRSPHDAGGRARLHQVLGRVARDSGRVDRSIDHYEAAIKEWSRVRTGFFVDEWWLQSRRGEPVVLEELMAVVLARRPRPTAREVWRRIARVRPRPAPTGSPAIPGPTPEARREAERLRQELDACLARLSGIDADVRGGHDRGAAPALEDRIRSIERRLRRLAAVGPDTRRRPASLRPAPGSPAPGETLLAYFSTGDRIGGLALHPGGQRLVRDLVSHEELELRVRLIREGFEAAEQESLASAGRAAIARSVDAHLAELGDRLLEPLLPRVHPGRRLRIVPYGPMNGIPFHMIRRDGGHLGAAHEILLGHPAGTEAPSRARAGRAMVLGFGAHTNAHAEREARLAARILAGAGVDVERHLGRDARRSTLILRAPEAGLVHLAAHGVYRAEHPEFSALRLADGWITTRELESMDLDGATVIVSACESGSLGAVAGDEALGMVRGLLRAGASTVLASLWSIDDRATSLFMKDLYRSWRRDGSLAPALRRTRRRFLAPGMPGSAVAGFVLYGQGTAPWPGLYPAKG